MFYSFSSCTTFITVITNSFFLKTMTKSKIKHSYTKNNKKLLKIKNQYNIISKKYKRRHVRKSKTNFVVNSNDRNYLLRLLRWSITIWIRCTNRRSPCTICFTCSFLTVIKRISEELIVVGSWVLRLCIG